MNWEQIAAIGNVVLRRGSAILAAWRDRDEKKAKTELRGLFGDLENLDWIREQREADKKEADAVANAAAKEGE